MKKFTAFILALTLAAGMIFALAPGASAAYLELDDIYSEYGLGQMVEVKGRTDLTLIMVYLAGPHNENLLTYSMSSFELLSGYSFRIGENWELGPYALIVGAGDQVVNEYHFDVVQEPVNHYSSSGGNNKVVATSISVSPSNISIKSGESAVVEVTSDEKTVRWETDDTDKISISGTTSATITGKRTGTAVAWAYSGNNYATVTVTVLPADKTPVGGNTEPSQSGENEPENTEPPKTEPEETRLPDAFTDLGDVDWARDSINALAAAGVVNGVGDGSFAPSRNVTRAEFVKMVVAAFGFEPKGEALSFTDVGADDWFAEVVNIAAQNGIVTGYDDGRFAPDNNISCQDAALILARVADMKGVNLPAPLTARQDGAAEYAREAVDILWSNGIISDEMGFTPRENATRAQSACMIYKIYELVQNNG